MCRASKVVLLCSLVVSAVALSSHAQHPYALFLGNSITYSRSGVDTATMVIADAMGDTIRTDRQVRGSSTIISIWDDYNVLQRVQTNDYTHVVLQPYVGDLSSVRNFATSCDTIFPRIQATGARVVLYLSWPFAASAETWDSVAVKAVYDSLAAAHDLDVVSVGPSFIWWHLITTVRMYDDHVHPSPMAQYLAGSFFYTYLLQKSPNNVATYDVYTTAGLGSMQAQKMYDQAAATLLSSAVTTSGSGIGTLRVAQPPSLTTSRMFDMLGRVVPTRPGYTAWGIGVDNAASTSGGISGLPR
jgi:hypothetical protein